jgi:chromosome partitioning protein
MALVAAGGEEQSGVVLVAEPEYDGLEGCIKAAEFVEGYSEMLGVPRLRVVGIVVNRTRNTDLHNSNIDALRDRFGDLVWDPHLPLWTTLADAHSSAVPLHSMPGPKAKELIERLDSLTDQLVKAMA